MQHSPDVLTRFLENGPGKKREKVRR